MHFWIENRPPLRLVYFMNCDIFQWVEYRYAYISTWENRGPRLFRIVEDKLEAFSEILPFFIVEMIDNFQYGPPILGGFPAGLVVRDALKLILENRSIDECIRSIDILANDIKLNLYLLYVKIPDNNLKKSLVDLEKLSILLFNKLVFFEM